MCRKYTSIGLSQKEFVYYLRLTIILAGDLSKSSSSMRFFLITHSGAAPGPHAISQE